MAVISESALGPHQIRLVPASLGPSRFKCFAPNYNARHGAKWGASLKPAPGVRFPRRDYRVGDAAEAEPVLEADISEAVHFADTTREPSHSGAENAVQSHAGT